VEKLERDQSSSAPLTFLCRRGWGLRWRGPSASPARSSALGSCQQQPPHPFANESDRSSRWPSAIGMAAATVVGPPRKCWSRAPADTVRRKWQRLASAASTAAGCWRYDGSLPHSCRLVRTGRECQTTSCSSAAVLLQPAPRSRRPTQSIVGCGRYNCISRAREPHIKIPPRRCRNDT
jgi:hypothetical protein